MMAMNLFKPRIWSIWEIACVKWSSISIGAIIGIFFADYLKEYVWFLVLGCVVLAIKPVAKVFSD
jgi:hypothetical protein